MDFFKSFVVSKPEFNLLPAGEAIVRLIRAEEVTSFMQFSGEPKAIEKPWKDATPQLAITVVTTEKGKSGGLTHRLNGRGYVKMDELTAEQKASGDYEDQEGYACRLNKDGLLVREVSEKHTKECANIINQFANAIGAKEGKPLGKQIQDAIADKTEFRVTVVNKPYNGKDQYRLDRFKAMTVATVDADFAE